MSDRNRSQGRGLGDFLLGQFREAVQDIRSKLVDEGWFGRRGPTPSQFDGTSLGWERPKEGIGEIGPTGLPAPQRFDELWAPRERAAEPSKEAPTPDLGIDL